MVKLLAVDLDGTLVRRDGQVDARDRDAIAKLHARGVAVSIVTGRLFAGTGDIARELGITSPLACADGAQLVDPTDGRELAHHGMVEKAAAALRAALRHRSVSAFLLYRDSVLHDQQGAPFTRFIRNWSPDLREVEMLYDHPAWSSKRGLSGAVAVGVAADVAAGAQELRASGLVEVIDFALRHSSEGPFDPPLRALLAHARGVSKGSAVLRLAQRLGCQASEVVAIGDWRNDVDMFAVAGRSFVMAHAPAEVRRAATDQLDADARSGGGLAEAVEKLWPRQPSPTG